MCPGFGLATVVLGFDRQGWIMVFAALLLASSKVNTFRFALCPDYSLCGVISKSTSWESFPQ
jgi:hypothetical protein